MKEIIRHEYSYADQDEFTADLEKRIDKIKKKGVPHFENNPNELNPATWAYSSLNLFYDYQSLPQEERNRALEIEILDYSLKFLCSYLNRAYHPQQLVKVQYGDRVLEQEGYEDAKDYLGADKWIKNFFFFMVCKNLTGINLIRNVSRDRLENSYYTALDIEYLRIELYQSLLKGGEGFWEAHEKCHQELMKAAKKYDVGDARELLSTFAMELACYYAIMLNNQSEFDSCLEEALETHKTYFSDFDNRGHSRDSGLISWPLLTVCSVAHRHGLAINFQSDYIPEWLYKAEFPELGPKFMED